MISKGNASKSGKIRVTFKLPSSIWAETVHLVGDFNGWNRQSHPLSRTEDGGWQIILELDKNHTYQFRYLINGTDWQNDWNADRYIANPFGGENSVLET